MTRPSIERSVARAYLASVVGVAATILATSTVATWLIVLRRDDAQATALAMTLATELDEHRAEPLASLDPLVRDELSEQRWFRRRVEAFLDGAPVGVTPTESRLSAFTGRHGCGTATIDGELARLCAVRPSERLVILVASPLSPILSAELPLLAAVALGGALAIALFAALARRVVRRSLRPLRDFERAIAALSRPDGERLASSWGAREIDELARTFDGLLARVGEVVLREKRFVANAAHELRTPLTRLRGQLEVVLREQDDGSDPARRLGSAVRSADELARALDSLLALSREDPLRLEPVDLDELARELHERLEPSDHARLRVESASALVRGDAILLGLAARNLVENALRHGRGDVVVRITDRGDRRALSVEDAGPGVAPEELDAVREPFVRGKGASARGAGLGLALADHVARRHGGRLSLANLEPHGLIASLELPAWRAGAIRERLGERS